MGKPWGSFMGSSCEEPKRVFLYLFHSCISNTPCRLFSLLCQCIYGISRLSIFINMWIAAGIRADLDI